MSFAEILELRYPTNSYARNLTQQDVFSKTKNFWAHRDLDVQSMKRHGKEQLEAWRLICYFRFLSQ